ncbi:hypothetical protein HDU96_000336 [Phlyctochytrium bullatum]|nr:hypothetical protein HDU96_000336 [Phlyctochytrium bullatum]
MDAGGAGPSSGIPRSLSNSMKAALSDPHLNKSLKDAPPRRAYQDGNSPNNSARQRFEKVVRRYGIFLHHPIEDSPRVLFRDVAIYYYQLTVGCKDPTCDQRLCASCPRGPRLTAQASAIMAVQLASRPRQFFCPRIAAEPDITLVEDSILLSQLMGTSTPRGTGSPSASRSATPANGTPISSPQLPRHRELRGGVPVLKPDEGALADSRPQSTVQQHLPGTRSPSPLPAGSERTSVVAPTEPDQQDTGSAHAAAATFTAAATPAQPQRPFLYSLLSNSPFAFFRTNSETRLDPNALHGIDVARTKSANPFLEKSNGSGTVSPSQQPPPLSLQPAAPIPMPAQGSAVEIRLSGSEQKQRSAYDYLGLSALGRLGSEASLKAKSWMDLPSLFSSALELPQAGMGKSVGTPERSASPFYTSEMAGSFNPQDGFDGKALKTPKPNSKKQFRSDTTDELDDQDQQLTLVYLTLPLLEKAIATYRVPTPVLSRKSIGDGNGTPAPAPPAEGLGTSILSHPSFAALSAQAVFDDDEDTMLGATRDPASFQTNDPAFLVNTIRTCFSSSEALNKSFLIEGVDLESYQLGVDVEAIRMSYQLILGLEPRHLFERTLVNAMEILMASLQLNLSKLQTGSPKHLRQFFALLENPLLRNRHYHETLLKKLCLVMGSLRTRSKTVLGRWLAGYDVEGLTSFIELFESYISDHYYPNAAKTDDAIVGAIKALQLLYHANEISGGRVPIDRFYNDALNRKLNFKEEYKTWKKVLETKKAGEFSFFNYPFLFDPVAKTRILHIDAMVQMSQEFEDAVVHQAIVIHAQKFLQDSPSVTNLEQGLKGATNPFLVLEVRRQHLVKDVLDQIRRKEKDMKKPLKVRFVGGGEEGMDQGGVQKEFFQVLVNMLLDPAYGMFTYEEETRYVWINGASLEPEKKFELVGTVIGLALYNGVILGINFPRILYKKLLDEEITLEDIKLAFPALGKGLQQLLDWSDGDVGDIFMRSFEISYDVYGQVKTFPLVENGDEILVTNENRQEYVHLYIKHLVNESVKRQFAAFRRGFYRVCGGRALKMCRAEELELLVCGTTNLDFTDLEKGAGYDDGYNPEHQVIQWFWDIVHNMSLEQKKKLLMFVTASDRVPLKGLGNLTFVIQRNGPDTDRLPTALTCFGRLLLPEYDSKEKLKNRLITAIENAKGFGLV